MRKKLLLIITIISLLLIIIGSFTMWRKKAPPIKETQPAKETPSVKIAPDFSLPDIEGNTFRLSDLKGKIVLIDFWATWCPFCRASIPILKELYNDYKDKGLEIVGIALEYDGGVALKRLVREENISYYVLLGNEKLAKEYSAFGVPTRFLINQKGEIAERFIGFQEKEILEEAVKNVSIKD